MPDKSASAFFRWSRILTAPNRKRKAARNETKAFDGMSGHRYAGCEIPPFTRRV
jgi:hypothetical protein